MQIGIFLHLKMLIFYNLPLMPALYFSQFEMSDGIKATKLQMSLRTEERTDMSMFWPVSVFHLAIASFS